MDYFSDLNKARIQSIRFFLSTMTETGTYI